MTFGSNLFDLCFTQFVPIFCPNNSNPKQKILLFSMNFISISNSMLSKRRETTSHSTTHSRQYYLTLIFFTSKPEIISRFLCQKSYKTKLYLIFLSPIVTAIQPRYVCKVGILILKFIENVDKEAKGGLCLGTPRLTSH